MAPADSCHVTSRLLVLVPFLASALLI